MKEQKIGRGIKAHLRAGCIALLNENKMRDVTVSHLPPAPPPQGFAGRVQPRRGGWRRAAPPLRAPCSEAEAPRPWRGPVVGKGCSGEMGFLGAELRS